MQAPNADVSSNGNNNDELREFFLILRDALLMVVRWIERRYMRR